MKSRSVWFLAAALCAFPAVRLSSQSVFSREPSWLKSGLYVGGLAQYRLHEKAYSLGFDGSYFTVVDSGDRIDLPVLDSMAGFGAAIGYVGCEGPREPAGIGSVRWTVSRGEGSSTIGGLAYVGHEIALVLEGLLPLSKGWALTGQFGWDFEFMVVSDGFLPSGGSRTDLLLSSFIGMEGGVGLGYVLDRRFLFEGRAAIRGFNANIASGGGASDGLGGEIGRFEYSFELSAGIVL